MEHDMTNTLPEIDAGAAPAHFRRRAHRARPVILRGIAAGWPAATRWTPSYLADRLGDRMVRLARWRSREIPTDPRRFLSDRFHEQRRLGDFLGELLRGAAPRNTYATDIRVLDPGGPLDGEFAWLQHLFLGPRCPAALRRALSIRPGLWIGAAGMVTPLHYDWNENFHVVISGRKRWTLFPPGVSRDLYAPWKGLSPIFTPIDIEQPDFASFPRFARAQAQAQVGELGAGDAVFIPVGWWHHAHTLEDTIALSQWCWSAASYRTRIKVAMQSVLPVRTTDN
jgi:[protein]-arginine 3-hydroxylase / protease